MKAKLTDNQRVLLIIAAVGIAMVTLSGALFSGYHFMDCSEFIQIPQRVKETSWAQALAQHFQADSHSRFRPAWNLYMHIVACMPWTDNMTAQCTVKIILNILAGFLLYRIGRKLNWSHTEGLFLAAFTLIGTQSAIFYQTVSQETTGLIFLAATWLVSLKLIYANRRERERERERERA